MGLLGSLIGGECAGLPRTLAESLTAGGGDRERDMLVDIVETEIDEAEDAERILLEAPVTSGSSLSRSCFRPLSSSSLASCSSATPFLW
jgi:hypothetical protein